MKEKKIVGSGDDEKLFGGGKRRPFIMRAIKLGVCQPFFFLFFFKNQCDLLSNNLLVPFSIPTVSLR